MERALLLEPVSKLLGEGDSPILLRGLRKIGTVPAFLKPVLCLCVLLAAASAVRAEDPQPQEATAAQAEFFERQVRPILAESCFSCHGQKKQHSGLRLDSRSGLLAGGENGPVVDLKNPGESRMLRAIGYDDAELQMPPDPPGKLPEPAIATLRRWIEQGAPWPEETLASRSAQQRAWKSHWAFAPVRRPSVPQVRRADWPRSPIDRFVLARLEAEGMSPGEPADRATLIRRATYDLIGLPPREEEVAAFVSDPAPDAFDRVVDRLLDSPHYGQRWGRYWLDVARYADTKGYVRLQEERRFHYAYTYRDYVVRAFNQDLPYDRFLVEQLAADQLPLGDDQQALAALGFLTLGRQFTSNPHDIIDDRIDVVTRGLLGLTVTCARCHDHKYDPIPTADYYSLYGVFASSEESIVPPLIGKPPGDPASQAFQQEFETRQRSLDEYEQQQYAILLDTFRARSVDYLVKAIEGREPPQQPLPMGHDALRQWIVERWIDAIERTDERHPVFGPWHAFSALKPGEFEAGASAILAKWTAPVGDAQPVQINAAIKNRLIAHPPKSMAEVARAYGELFAQVHERWRTLTASTTAAAGSALARLPEESEEALRRVLYAPDGPVAVSRQEALAQYLYDAPINDEVMKRRNAVNQHLANTAQAPPRAHTLVEHPLPYDPRIFLRGNPTRPGNRVPRQFLQALSGEHRQPFVVGSGRLELAQAVASRDNPLTARVLVNRVWGYHFGAGLVRTPSNFGLRGQPPTHPELLDYLAARFMDEGWSIKKLHRWIMLSGTYQQSSRDRADQQVRDPENRLLWKMNRRRLDFEALRDSLLMAAGRLDLSLGGPSIDLTLPTANRRTIYGLIDRQGLPGMLPTFDFASPDTHSPERYTTTVPQQALFLMNGPLAAEWTRSFVQRADVKDLADPPQRVARMVAIAWGRSPTQREKQWALEFIERDRATNPGGDTLDAWEAFAQTLLLANEFSYVD